MVIEPSILYIIIIVLFIYILCLKHNNYVLKIDFEFTEKEIYRKECLYKKYIWDKIKYKELFKRAIRLLSKNK